MDDPYWTSGWFGVLKPEQRKFFRTGNLITDRKGFTVANRIVDHEQNTLQNPGTIAARSPDDEKVTINRKGTLLSYTINFPTADVDATVLQLSNSHKPRSDR